MDLYSRRRIELRVLGLSYREIKEGAYALILSEVGGQRYIPIIIGTSEAQAIAMRLEHFVPAHPVLHDIFSSLSHAFGIRLREVFINSFEDGIFMSELTFEGPDNYIVTLEARTSDAIAIAMRSRSPIYTTPEIIEETGFLIETKTTADPDAIRITVDAEDKANEEFLASDNDDDSNISTAALEEQLADLIASERYEEAAIISEKIRRRRAGDLPL